MGKNETTLTANQRPALEALLEYSTIGAAAAACGLHRRTLSRYLADPVFRDALRDRQDQVTARVTARLAGGAELAVKVLDDILKSPLASDANKRLTALGWLNQWRTTIELDDLVARITALEQNR